MLSPPCTIFSVLQRLWNVKKWTREDYAAKLERGTRYVEHSMDCAIEQMRLGQFFAYEHPSSASSWQLDVVQRVRQLPGVHCVTFDMCQFGLQSRSGIPMRKRTRIMTNSCHVARAFSGKLCNGDHPHQIIQGSECGVRRSTLAQIYPTPMLRALSECVCDQLRNA